MLKEKIQADLIAAMKAKEAARLSTLRMLTAAIKNKEIEKHPIPSTDDEVLSVIASEVKKRTDAVLDYTKGGRPELAQKENEEKKILESYLPAQLTDAELAILVDATIQASNATKKKDFGAVMKILMPKVKGKTSGNTVSDLVRQRLTKA